MDTIDQLVHRRGGEYYSRKIMKWWCFRPLLCTLFTLYRTGPSRRRDEAKLMTKLAPEWVRTSDPVIRSPVHYRWTTAPAPRKIMNGISYFQENFEFDNYFRIKNKNFGWPSNRLYMLNCYVIWAKVKICISADWRNGFLFQENVFPLCTPLKYISIASVESSYLVLEYT